MDIQETIDIRYEEIEGLKQKLSEDHYMNPEQEDELEELIAQAIKFGELCAKRDAKAQAVPEGFVLVEKTKLMQIVGSAAIIEPITRGNPLMSKYKTELDFILSTVRAMIEAQEPAND